MLRWVLFSLLVIVVAAAGTAVSQFLAVPGQLESVAVLKPTPEGDSGHNHTYDGPKGKAVVVGDSTLWDFGILPQKTDGSHDWTIKNEGPGIVELEMGQTSCSCTYSDFKLGDHVKLQPGETKTIKVSFNTKEWDKFHQTAPIMVHNDAERQTIELTIEGIVRPAVSTDPPDRFIPVALINNDATITRSFAVFSYDRPKLKIEEISTSNPNILSVKYRPLESKELEHYKVKEGHWLTLTLKPSAKLGQFTEEIFLKLDHPMQNAVKFTVTGNRVGPISVFPDRIRLFNVVARDGAKQTLTVLVRGHEKTKFTVDHTPKSVGVDVAPMGAFEEGKAKRYQVTVTIPPNTSPGSIIDDIVIKTDHPSASELKIPISVVVGQAG